ncbi:MAG: HAD hydrolase family protein, partial [Thermoanaerobaculia bacterium]|nr:HAD hydrolase family protein [Thermoanaerobaculia bacterium]
MAKRAKRPAAGKSASGTKAGAKRKTSAPAKGSAKASAAPPGTRFPAELRRRAAAVRLLAFDSDGTLTDRGMGWDDAGHEFRRFDVRDGLAMKWAMRAGLHVVVVSGRISRAAGHRFADLEIPDYQGAQDKVAVLERLVQERGLEAQQVAYLGDDLPDLQALYWCGLPLAVADAHPLVRAASVWSAPSPGGRGAVREAIEAVLDATDLWHTVLER